VVISPYHQVFMPSPITSSTSAQILKSITTSSTPNPSQTRRTSGSSGTPATPPCTPMHNATFASGIAASPPKVNPRPRPPSFLPPQRLQLPQHLRSTHIPPCLHRWHHLRRLLSPAHLRPRPLATPPQVRRGVRRRWVDSDRGLGLSVARDGR
jgi:hypothetical protein